MSKSRVDPRIRAAFREKARDIVLRDRQAKKFGFSQNTIGEIERAMIEAYKAGQEIGDQPLRPLPGPDDALRWEQIPPRGRQTLDWMAYQPPGYDAEKPIGLRALDINGKPRYGCVYRDGLHDAYTVHPSAVEPLQKLGILEPSTKDTELLVLSKRGKATCEAYLERTAAGDRSLPKLNLRA